MTEALKCPSCSAPLQPPAGNATTMRCPYCNTTVMLRADSDSPAAGQGQDVAAFGPMISDALEKAKLAGLLRQGSKIEAIKFYRQTYNTDLHTAKAAIDQMAAPTNTLPGRASNDPVAQAVKIASSGAKLGIGIALATTLFVIFIISFAMHSVPNALVNSTRTITTPSFIPSLPAVPALPPPPPAFADMKLEFGSEGIGAGQFKDSRSICIDNTGKIYVGEYSDGRIQTFDQTGKFLSEWTLGKGKYLQDLTADHQGNLYVVTAEKITRYDAATHMPLNDFESTTDPNSYDPEEYSDAFAALNGSVYACGGTHIIVLTPDGKITKVYKEADAIGEDISFERIAVSGEGDIYVLNRQKGVFKFSSDGHYINRFGGGEGMGPGYINAAQNIAVDGQGRILIAGANPAIQVYDAEGRFINSFGGNEVCFGMAINDQNEIFACFRNQCTVRKYVINKPKPAFP